MRKPEPAEEAGLRALDDTARPMVAGEGEERFRSAFEYAAIAMALVGLDGRWLRVNRSTCAMLGYGEAELLALDFQQLTPPEDLETDMALVAALLAGQIPSYQLEKRYFHKDGHVVWGLLSVSLVRDGAGEPLYFISQIQDVTQRKRAEAALADSERRFRAVFDQTFQLLVLITPAGRILEVNEAVLTGVGFPRERFIGGLFWDAPGWRHSAAVRERIRQSVGAAAAGEFVRFEVDMVDEAGRPVDLDFSIKPVTDGAGRVVFLLAEGRDITELKAALAGLAHRTAELEKARELDRLKSNFINAVSHEIRTPLTLIKGFAEFLADGIGGPLNGPQAEFVHQLEQGANRLEYLVNDLLDYARIEAGTFDVRIAPGDLAFKVREIVESFQPLLAEAQLSIALTLEAERIDVPMDAQRVGQVLTNLLSNAMKFAPAGSTIGLDVRRVADAVRVTVADAGPGIAPEDVPKLFHRFTQLEAGLRKGKGTGLGLSISKSIVEAHGGHIGVESAPDAGSRFWFTLPEHAALRPATAEGAELPLEPGR